MTHHRQAHLAQADHADPLRHAVLPSCRQYTPMSYDAPMQRPANVHDEQRPGEIAGALPDRFDAQIYFIGVIHTPWTKRGECPRRGDLNGPVCRIEVFEPFRQALAGVERHTHLQILYWMDRARRDLLLQMPRGAADATGAFGLRSPIRPNPIASSLVAIVDVQADGVLVRGLDCLDGTPLVDIKPEHCPGAPPTD
jgi:tRNA-Thr(GGU) m(6)t(6)A37 methyltransferase TsaA